MEDIRIRYVADTSDINKAQRALAGLTDEEKNIVEGFQKINQESSKAAKGVDDNFSKLNGTIKNVGGVLAGVFAADQLISFGKKVFDVTAEFQKFEAVLTNTLGSNSKAQIALAQIADFAAKTPFSVAQLTASFVKLANQGFIPTTNQLRQLGDLAASTGKDFDQLAEAIIDAQTGEFERLKEFGIRAQKEGDKVRFTFKGVETQVLNTNDAITGYITGLGDLQGVTGSMAAISETLGGQVSNLGDSFDQLFLTIGNGTGGVMSSFISAINDSVNALIRLISTSDQIKENSFLKVLGEQSEETKKQITDLIELNKRLGQSEGEARSNAVEQVRSDIVANIAIREKEILDLKEQARGETGKQVLATGELVKEAQNGLRVEQERLDALNKINTEFNKTPQAAKLTTKELKEQSKLLADMAGFASLQDMAGELDAIFNSYAKGQGALWKLINEEEFNASADEAEERLKDLADKGAGAFKPSAPDDQGSVDPEVLKEQRIREARQATFDLSVDLVNALFDISANKRQADLDNLEAEKERELALVGDNEQAKAFINEKFDKQQAAMKQRQAIAERNQALFNIAIQTATAITRTLAEVPKFDFGVSTAALVAIYAAMGAIQAGVVASRPIPKFATGTEFLNGRSGTDTNLIWANTGERIVPKEINAQLRGIKNSDLPRLAHLRDFPGGESGADSIYAQILAEQKQTNKNFKKLKLLQVNVDRKGVSTYMIEGNQEKEILNKQFSI